MDSKVFEQIRLKYIESVLADVKQSESLVETLIHLRFLGMAVVEAIVYLEKLEKEESK